MQYYLVVMDHTEMTVTQYKLPIGWEDMDDVSSVDEYAERYMHIDLSNANWMLTDRITYMNNAWKIKIGDAR
jgi:hypothetical protein